MSRWLWRSVGMAVLVAGLVGLRSLEAPGQQSGTAGLAQPRVTGDRFEFEVVRSRDADYLGDTVSHWGRYGGLGDRRPNVALGDPVYRDQTKIGTITALVWERAKGSLEIEFDPEPFQRVSVGEIVWVRLGGAKSGASDRP